MAVVSVPIKHLEMISHLKPGHQGTDKSLRALKKPVLERDVWSIGKAVFDEAGGNQHNITEALGEGG